MELKTIHIEETPEKFDQWLRQLASEQGFAISEDPQGIFRQYSFRRDGEEVAQVEATPLGDRRLRLRPYRLRLQYTPGGTVRGDFIEMLDKALQADYRAEPIEDGISGSFIRGIIDLEREQFDNPEDEAKRQAYVAELSRGLPPIAQSEPPTTQVQGARPNLERKYRTTRDALERTVRDFTRKWSGDSAQRAPFVDVREEWIGQAQIEIEGKCESPKGLENAFEYLPMVKLTPTIINAEWLKIEVWAMDWTDNPSAKKTVDNFLVALIQELDHYLGDAPGARTPTEVMQAQDAKPTNAHKVMGLSTNQIAIIGLVIAFFACLGTYLGILPQVHDTIQSLLHAVTPALTPILGVPTATP